MPPQIAFHDLKPLRAELAGELAAAVERVLASGWYILGPEVAAFEEAFAAYHAVPHCVGVASGTDALELALRAAGVGPGDEVITVSHTAVATVCAIERAGASPVLVDVDAETFTMDPAAAAAAVGPRTRAIVPVHLYGHPADLDALGPLAERHRLALIEDCAQAHGARWRGRRVGTFGHLAAFSFYPTKNLGAYGDGGAVLTADAALATRLRSLRNYGQRARYHHHEAGINSRLDEIQAAILRVKLGHLDRHNEVRRGLAAAYRRHLSGVTLPRVAAAAEHAFHLFVVRHSQAARLRGELAAAGIETLVHYPFAVHQQPAYAHLGVLPGALPVTEALVGEIVSLPLYPGLLEGDLRRVAAGVVAAAATLATPA